MLLAETEDQVSANGHLFGLTNATTTPGAMNEGEK